MPDHLWESIAQLQAASAEYRRTWWLRNDAVADLVQTNRYPGLLGRLSVVAEEQRVVTTQSVYAEHGAYVPERTELQRRIADSCVPTSPLSRQPRAYFTIGCFGVGKTHTLRRLVQLHRDSEAPGPSTPAAIVDADHVRQELPEYEGGLGSEVVNRECFDITYDQVLPLAIERRVEIIFDTLGRMPSIRGSLDRLRHENYQVHILHGSAPLDVCQTRTEQRALREDGRTVDPALLAEAAQQAAEVIGTLQTEGYPLAGWANIGTEDDRPRLVDGTNDWQAILDLP